jgi:hypothetical protein
MPKICIKKTQITNSKKSSRIQKYKFQALQKSEVGF